VVPYLEANATHLFNPEWPGHARLHEAWQLLANILLAALCLWLTWGAGQTRLAATILLAITGSFVVAYAASGLYGGSMGQTTSVSLELGGINPAVLVMVVATVALAAGLIGGRRRG
jgi:hypothetical protein